MQSTLDYLHVDLNILIILLTKILVQSILIKCHTRVYPSAVCLFELYYHIVIHLFLQTIQKSVWYSLFSCFTCPQSLTLIQTLS